MPPMQPLDSVVETGGCSGSGCIPFPNVPEIPSVLLILTASGSIVLILPLASYPYRSRRILRIILC